MMLELPGGRQGVALSDGMGSGEKACRESTLVIELLEELLEAGFPEKNRNPDDQHHVGHGPGRNTFFHNRYERI